jgi:hypothetical protein
MMGIKIFAVTLLTTAASLAWAYFMHWIEEPISGFILSWFLVTIFVSIICALVVFRYFDHRISQWNWLITNLIFFASLLGISMAEVAGKHHVNGDSSMAGFAMLGGLINGVIIGVLAGIVIGYGEKILFSYIKSANYIQSILDGFTKGVYIGIISGLITFVFATTFGSIIPKNVYWNSFLDGLLLIVLFSPVIGGVTGTMSRLSHNIKSN